MGRGVEISGVLPVQSLPGRLSFSPRAGGGMRAVPLMAAGLRLARGKNGPRYMGAMPPGVPPGQGEGIVGGIASLLIELRVQPETLKRGFRVWRPQKKRCIRGYFGPGAVGCP